MIFLHYYYIAISAAAFLQLMQIHKFIKDLETPNHEAVEVLRLGKRASSPKWGCAAKYKNTTQSKDIIKISFGGLVQSAQKLDD